MRTNADHDHAELLRRRAREGDRERQADLKLSVLDQSSVESVHGAAPPARQTVEKPATRRHVAHESGQTAPPQTLSPAVQTPPSHTSRSLSRTADVLSALEPVLRYERL